MIGTRRGADGHTGAECADACEGGPLLEAVASPVKSTTGATIWTELPDVSVTYSAVLWADSDAMLTKFLAKSLKRV